MIDALGNVIEQVGDIRPGVYPAEPLVPATHRENGDVRRAAKTQAAFYAQIDVFIDRAGFKTGFVIPNEDSRANHAVARSASAAVANDEMPAGSLRGLGTAIMRHLLVVFAQVVSLNAQIKAVTRRLVNITVDSINYIQI